MSHVNASSSTRRSCEPASLEEPDTISDSGTDQSDDDQDTRKCVEWNKDGQPIGDHKPTGRRGAACTAEMLMKEDPNLELDRTGLFLATHTRKDGTAPTVTSSQKIDAIKAINNEDPSQRKLDLDHDPVAQVMGRDSRGRILGMGSGVSKTTIRASRKYRKRMEKDSELRRLEKKLDRFMKQQSTSQDSQMSRPGTSSSSQAQQQTSVGGPPSTQTGVCMMKNFQEVVVAIGKVIGAAPGSTTGIPYVEVLFVEIMDRTALLPNGGGGTLGDYTPGEIVLWPSYYVSYLSS